MKRTAETGGSTCAWPSTESENKDARELKLLGMHLNTPEAVHRIDIHPWPREQLNDVFETLSESMNIDDLTLALADFRTIPSHLPLDFVDAARRNPYIVRLELEDTSCIVPAFPALRSLLRQTNSLRELSLNFDTFDVSPPAIEPHDANMLAKAIGINTSLKKLSITNLGTALFQEMAKFSQHNLDTIKFGYFPPPPLIPIQLSGLSVLIGSKHVSFKDVNLQGITSSASDTEQFTNALAECSTIVNLSLKDCAFEINPSRESDIFHKWKKALCAMPSLRQIILTPYGPTFPNILAIVPMKVLKIEHDIKELQEEKFNLAIQALADNLIEQYEELERTPLTAPSEAMVLHTLEISKISLAGCFDHVLRILVSPSCLLQKLKIDRCRLNENHALHLAEHLQKMSPFSPCRDIDISFHVVNGANANEAYNALLSGLRRNVTLETFKFLKNGTFWYWRCNDQYKCFSNTFPYCTEAKFYTLRNKINRTVREAGEDSYSAADLWFETINAIRNPDNPELATLSATYQLLETENNFLTQLIKYLQQEQQALSTSN